MLRAEMYTRQGHPFPESRWWLIAAAQSVLAWPSDNQIDNAGRSRRLAGVLSGP
jgi:hypothetical protein